MAEFKDLVGQRFGKLTVMSRSVFVGNGKKPVTYWDCKCDCDQTTRVRSALLLNGNTKSCGCLARTTRFKTKHSKSFSHEYRAWCGMKKRCSNADGSYHTYSQNGIKVCDEWIDSFETFYKDMGDAPSSKHTIDRIDNLKGYYKENCRWATSKEQNRNYSQNRLITYNGETMCVTEWAEKLSIPRHRIYQRLSMGWSTERVLTN